MELINLFNLAEIGSGELRITLVVCGLSLIAVWWPLTRGALLCWRARAATRIPSTKTTQSSNPAHGRVVGLLEEVHASITPDGDEDRAQPEAFLRDAAKRLVVDDYEASFAQPISMYANILPPIGFIGTTCGLAVLLLSMHISHDVLQMGALALALSSTIFGLVGYAILESLKIHLYTRLARSLDAGMRAQA